MKGAASDKTNAVASFITGFSSDSRSFDGVCIKYAMRDRTIRLSFFDQRWFHALYQCVEYYSCTRYYGSDMQREADEPGFVARLAMRHPVRTMASEKPHLTDDEYEVAKRAHRVAALRMADLGDTCRLICQYTDGGQREELLPGYIIMNLCAYLDACANLHGLMTGAPSGSA